MRDRLGELEDRFFSSVLFGGRLLFLAMTLFARALTGGLLTTYDALPAETVESGIYTFDRSVVYRPTNVFAIRMAGVFMISAGTIWLRSRAMPRWMVLLTYGLAAGELVTVSYDLWVTPIFPRGRWSSASTCCSPEPEHLGRPTNEHAADPTEAPWRFLRGCRLLCVARTVGHADEHLSTRGRRCHRQQ